MTKILRYLGRDSPWGPESAGIFCALVFILTAAIAGPPIIFVMVHVFGWWWRLWL
jgi:hypothetical protein